jgi:hypothetical protein
MTTYAVFDRDAKEAPAVVPERFSWFAAILPPIYALVHGLWLELVGYIVAVVLLSLASNTIGDGAAFWVYVLFAIWLGFEAPSFRKSALKGRGWRYRTDVIAAGADLAELEGMKSRP